MFGNTQACGWTGFNWMLCNAQHQVQSRTRCEHSANLLRVAVTQYQPQTVICTWYAWEVSGIKIVIARSLPLGFRSLTPVLSYRSVSNTKYRICRVDFIFISLHVIAFSKGLLSRSFKQGLWTSHVHSSNMKLHYETTNREDISASEKL